jgi:hypothetical protein
MLQASLSQPITHPWSMCLSRKRSHLSLTNTSFTSRYTSQGCRDTLHPHPHPIHCTLHVMSHLTPTAKVPKRPCICQRLHQYCDPALCSEASGAALQSKTFSLPWIKLVNSAKAGCHTCQILRQSVEIFENWPSMDDRELLKAIQVEVETDPGVGPVVLSPYTHSVVKLKHGSGLEIRQISPLGKSIKNDGFQIMRRNTFRLQSFFCAGRLQGSSHWRFSFF